MKDKICTVPVFNQRLLEFSFLYLLWKPQGIVLQHDNGETKDVLL